MAEFVFRKDTELLTFTNYDDIPSNLDFDHVIKFSPDCPPAPHNEEQHAEMERWTQRLQEFMEKENQ